MWIENSVSQFQEMNLLVEADQPGNQLDNYISRLNAILSQKAAGILELQNQLAHFQRRLKEHNVLISSGNWSSNSVCIQNSDVIYFGRTCCCRSTNGTRIGVGVENMWIAKVGVATFTWWFLQKSFWSLLLSYTRILSLFIHFLIRIEEKFDRCFGMGLKLCIAKIATCWSAEWKRHLLCFGGSNLFNRSCLQSLS